MVVIFEEVVFESNFPRVEVEMIEGQADGMEDDMEVTMTRKRSAIIAMDLVIGHVIAQRRGTKENVTTAANLDTNSVIAPPKEGVSAILHEARGAADPGVVAHDAAEVLTGVEALDGVLAEVLTGVGAQLDQEAEAPGGRADKKI